MRDFFVNLIGSRNIILHFVKRDLSVKYRNSILGFFWTFLKPMFMFFIINFVFSLFIKFDTGPAPYPLFLIISLFPWVCFQGTISEGSFSILSNSNLIRKIGFPREIIPTSFCITQFIHFLLSYSIIIVISCIFIKSVSWTIFLIIPILMLLFLFTWALNLIFSCLNVLFRDIGHSLELFLLLWFYSSPIFYPLYMATNSIDSKNWPGIVKSLYLANPITYLLTSLRICIVYPHDPLYEITQAGFTAKSFLIYSVSEIAFIFILFMIGIKLFKRLESTVLDTI